MTNKRLGALMSLALSWLACTTPQHQLHPSRHQPRTEPPAARLIPTPPSSFERAKKLALGIYADHRVTLYCGCEYLPNKRVLAKTCGYTPRSSSRRTLNIEWEHIVPAHSFGAQRACWVEKACRDSKGRAFGGRRCCRQRDDEFRRMEADLQNLTPELGELNGDRSNFGFGEVAGEPRLYGACDFEVSRPTRTAEPPESVRGEIARAYLYMLRVYGPAALPLAPSDIERFERWHRADPPTRWELLRDARIKLIQRVGSPLLRD